MKLQLNAFYKWFTNKTRNGTFNEHNVAINFVGKLFISSEHSIGNEVSLITSLNLKCKFWKLSLWKIEMEEEEYRQRNIVKRRTFCFARIKIRIKMCCGTSLCLTLVPFLNISQLSQFTIMYIVTLTRLAMTWIDTPLIDLLTQQFAAIYC